MKRREERPDDAQAQRLRIREDLSLASEVMEQYRNKRWQSLETWAGDQLDAMLASRSQTETCLRHTNWSLRLTALLLLDDRWQAVPSLANDFAGMVLTDSTSVVRGVALRLLAGCVLNESLSELPECVRHLSPVVLDDPTPADAETEEARSLAVGMLRDIAKFKVADRQRRREDLHQLAGSLVDAMQQDMSLALASLEHSEPSIRCAALKLFGGHWKPPADFDQICLRMLNEDGDTLVRCTALTSFMTPKVGLEGRTLGPRLAALVQDVVQPLDLRELAYFWLLRLRGDDILDWRPLPREEAAFAAAIDWSFLRSFSQIHEGE